MDQKIIETFGFLILFKIFTQALVFKYIAGVTQMNYLVESI